VIKTCYSNGQKERLCLIIDKCRRQNGCGKRLINLNKIVAAFEKHIFLSQTDLTEIQNFQREDFILWELHSKILVGDKNLL
jgi:hypothetical protein